MSFGIKSSLTPLANQFGFVMRIELTNRGPTVESVRVRTQVDPGGPSRFG